jgi:hypothetical protein
MAPQPGRVLLDVIDATDTGLRAIVSAAVWRLLKTDFLVPIQSLFQLRLTMKTPRVARPSRQCAELSSRHEVPLGHAHAQRRGK